MADIEKVIYGIERHICRVPDACRDCEYNAKPYDECEKALLRDALELLKAQRWISVKKDLPGISCMVLITGKNGAGGSFGVVKGMYDHKKGWYRDDIGQFADGRGDVITHWMPLPEPPKEET